MRVKETTGGTLLSIHNIFYLISLTQKCRQAIIDGTFRELFEQLSAEREQAVLAIKTEL